MNAIKDLFIPHISQKKKTKNLFDALVSLYQDKNINKKMILWNKLRAIDMTKLNTVTNHLMKVAQIRDQHVAVGEKIADEELVNMAPKGFLALWETFVQKILAHGHLPSLETLWDDDIQEETRMDSNASQKDGNGDLVKFICCYNLISNFMSI